MTRELEVVREEERQVWLQLRSESGAFANRIVEQERVRWSEAVAAGEESSRVGERRWRK